jgi:hypothetical protein
MTPRPTYKTEAHRRNWFVPIENIDYS